MAITDGSIRYGCRVLSFNAGTFVSWLVIDGDEIIQKNMVVLLYTDYGFEKTANFMQLKIV